MVENTGTNNEGKGSSETGTEGLAPVKRTSLTTGQKSIMLSQVIDMLNAGLARTEIHSYIKSYSKEVSGVEYKNTNFIINEAKKKWLSSFNMPDLDIYKKDQLIKSEILEEELAGTTRDVTHKSKAMIELWQYRDGLAGLKNDNGVNVSIGIDLSDNDIVDTIPQAKVIDIDAE